MIKNPYIYSYLPLISIVLFSLTFGLYSVNEAIIVSRRIGVYTGMREFLSEVQMRALLLVIFATLYFMIFSTLKLIGETIHEVGMLFFTKDTIDSAVNKVRGGSVVFFFGSLVSVAGLTNLYILGLVFLLSVVVYFIFVTYKLSNIISFGAVIGVMMFEIVVWAVILTSLAYAVFKLYNVVLSSLPFN